MKRVILLLVITVLLAACGGQGAAENELGAFEADRSVATAPPGMALTMQAEVEQTAFWVGTVAPELVNENITPTPTLLPATLPVEATRSGLPYLSDRRGECPVPGGFTYHERLGFCISAPDAWLAVNVDGSVTSVLGTTPGQSIVLAPGGEVDANTCQLLVYITEGTIPAAHLQLRYDGIANQQRIQSITAIGVFSVAGFQAAGFIWETVDSEIGGVFADDLSLGRLAHVSYRGLSCETDELLLTLETLRFN